MKRSTDDDLLALLRVNARESVSVLARKLDMSRSTVQDRIRKLEASGVIAGYSVIIGDDEQAAGVRAFVTITVEPKQAARVATELRAIAQVDALHTVTGKYDMVALVRARSPGAMDELFDRIGAVPGIVRTESAIILTTKLDRR